MFSCTPGFFARSWVGHEVKIGVGHREPDSGYGIAGMAFGFLAIQKTTATLRAAKAPLLSKRCKRI